MSDQQQPLREYVRHVAHLGSLREVFANAGRGVDWMALPQDNAACADELRAAIEDYFTAREQRAQGRRSDAS